MSCCLKVDRSQSAFRPYTGKGAISLNDVLNDIEVPSLEAPDLDVPLLFSDRTKTFLPRRAGGMERFI